MKTPEFNDKARTRFVWPLTVATERAASGPRRRGRMQVRAASAAVLLALMCALLLAARAVPARAADDAPVAASTSSCNTADLSDSSDTARNDPIWTPVLSDPNHPIPNDPATILQGTVAAPDQKFPNGEQSSSQAPSEVAEEDLPWNHYTHDKTSDVIPDPGYKHLLSSWVNPDGSTGSHNEMEVEWENASLMGDNRTWGAEPEFVWPSVRDRVWVSGRWVFDCGHPGSTQAGYVRYSTEIHPPRGEVTFRTHPTLADSWLPVTGLQTNVPVTEAAMFFSGNGGGANDRCNLINRHIHATGNVFTGGITGIDACTHTGPVLATNDRNYVFDVYPPGTTFDPSGHDASKPWPVTPPTADSSLQWRWIDESYQIPDHACGQTKSRCVPLTSDKVLVCPIGASTPPPTDQLDETGQLETKCPAAPTPPERATRLRVILPFNGTSYNVLAQTLLLGWDDVPASSASSVRKFKITLHQLDVVHNGESGIHSGDWRVFVDVGGEWHYVSNQFDTVNGNNACSGTSLDQIGGAGGNGDGDCFRFDHSPWTVSVQNGTPIHVAVGGFESDSVDSDFCPQSDTGNYFGCDPSLGSAYDLATANDDRIGTYEFDLSPPDYSAPAPTTTTRLDDGEQYKTTFTVHEMGAATPPTSEPLGIGEPQYTSASGTFVTSSTPLTLSTRYTGNVGFQYRYHRDGTALPTYSTNPFDVYWTSTDFVAGPRQVPRYLTANDGADGPYTVHHSVQTEGGLTEPRHTAHLTLDNTPPAITINQPLATTYTHSQTLTLDYAVSDGAGSGVKSITPTIDGAATLAGHGLQSGQSIDLLTELALGPHTFTANAVDNVGNSGSSSVTFTIIVTAQSIIDDVTQLVASGAITQNEGTSLVSKLVNAKRAREARRCASAAAIYQAFINEVQAQSGKKITASAAAILIADANYLIAHCP